jgi:hypothetical protein
MSTTNKRAGQIQACTINGVSAGGIMSIGLQFGFDQVVNSPADGLGVPVYDKQTQFCRGNVRSQDWVHLIELLTGTVGTLICYERKSGAAEASGYIKHTVNNPIVHQMALKLSHRAYADIAATFECKAADETKGFDDMYTQLDAQAAPTYVPAARGLEMTAVLLGGSLAISHVTGLDLMIKLPVGKASSDGDVGYTAVDQIINGMTASGSLRFQDSSISTTILSQRLLAAVVGNLVLTVKQSSGATAKTLTIARVDFTNVSDEKNNDVQNPYTEHVANFVINNDPSTPLTLEGANKIITIA